MVLRLPDSWSNWNLEMLVFEERGKPEYPEKNLSEQGREPTTNLTHIWRRRRHLNPRHIGERRVLSPLRHPFSPKCTLWPNYCFDTLTDEMKTFSVQYSWNVSLPSLQLDDKAVQHREVEALESEAFKEYFVALGGIKIEQGGWVTFRRNEH